MQVLWMHNYWSLYWFHLVSIFFILGPRPDLDPDIVAALDDALDLNDPDNILEDDFMLKVMEMSLKRGFFFLRNVVAWE